uniref:Uncharacterized protein n=1 Tax=Podoviridae sp. ctNY03 TaxID=2823558 RepID=A0A8S5LAH5_9CAUD|nr:MAG TPA: hypothetical protein [Podoviridae sp. ctNY03]
MRRFDFTGIVILFSVSLLFLLVVGFVAFAIGVASTLIPVAY